MPRRFRSIRVPDTFKLFGRRLKRFWKKRGSKLRRLAGKTYKEDAPKKLRRFWCPYY